MRNLGNVRAQLGLDPPPPWVCCFERATPRAQLECATLWAQVSTRANARLSHLSCKSQMSRVRNTRPSCEYCHLGLARLGRRWPITLCGAKRNERLPITCTHTHPDTHQWAAAKVIVGREGRERAERGAASQPRYHQTHPRSCMLQPAKSQEHPRCNADLAPRRMNPGHRCPDPLRPIVA